MTVFLQASFEGLALGAVYSLVAIGFVLIYKATDVLSFSQPALAVVGAGAISALAVDRGINFWIALIIALIATGLLGSLLERIFLRPMVGEPVFSVAILTLGLDIILRTVLDNWIGVNPRYMGDPIVSWGQTGSIIAGGVVFKFQEMGALLTAVLAVIFLGYFFKVSKYGIAMRATSLDQEASLAQGINVGRIFGLVWFIGGILAASVLFPIIFLPSINSLISSINNVKQYQLESSSLESKKIDLANKQKQIEKLALLMSEINESILTKEKLIFISKLINETALKANVEINSLLPIDAARSGKLCQQTNKSKSSRRKNKSQKGSFNTNYCDIF